MSKFKRFFRNLTHSYEFSSDHPKGWAQLTDWLQQMAILSPENKPFRLALCISLLIHVAILLVQIAPPSLLAVRQADIPLEVELVNARSTQPPQKAEVLAQANLNGGGDHDQGRATTPLPATLDSQAGELIKHLQKRAAELTEEQQRLLTQNGLSYLLTKKYQEQLNPNAASVSGKDAHSSDLIRQRLEAVIARDQQLIAKRPRRAQITASSAMGVDFAQYYDKVRRKIEHYGTLHFPNADGKPLYGSLVLTLSIRQDGRLGYVRDGYQITDVVLQRSSGNQMLDREAIAIARAAAPFGPFTPEMIARYEILDIIYTFQFTRSGLEAKPQANML
jgi:protein TonB